MLAHAAMQDTSANKTTAHAKPLRMMAALEDVCLSKRGWTTLGRPPGAAVGALGQPKEGVNATSQPSPP